MKQDTTAARDQGLNSPQSTVESLREQNSYQRSAVSIQDNENLQQLLTVNLQLTNDF